MLFPLLLLVLMGGVELFVFLLLANWDSRVIVETLSHELERQGILLAGGFLDFGPLVLEPDLDLVLVQLQFVGQLLASLLVQVTILRELVFETG